MEKEIIKVEVKNKGAPFFSSDVQRKQKGRNKLTVLEALKGSELSK